MSQTRYFKMMDGKETVGVFATPAKEVENAMRDMCEMLGHKVVAIDKAEYERLEEEE